MLNSLTTRDKRLIIVAGAAWLAIVTCGFAMLAHEEFTPVATAPEPTGFPATSKLPLATSIPTLVLFAHPQCPCTRATLHELDGLLARTGEGMSVVIVFTIPSGVPAGWEKGELWDRASRMPGVQVARDVDGVEARRFRVSGSGHALLFAPSGKLLFSGGITVSRGHEGDNAGCDAIEDFVLHGTSVVTRTPVFGCSLL